MYFYPNALICFESPSSVVGFLGVKPRKCFTIQLARGVQETCKVIYFCDGIQRCHLFAPLEFYLDGRSKEGQP